MTKEITLKWAVCLLLAVAVLILFSPALGFDFLSYDDSIYVQKNPYLQKGFTLQAISWAFSADLLFDSMNADYWQPVTFLSRLADFQFWGLNPLGHHLTNILLHIANSILLFLLLAAATRSLWASAWVALIFALHPLSVQPVAWVTARKDLLSALFGLLAIASYLRWVRRPSRQANALTALCLALSLMAKPVFVTLPAILLALDYWPLNRLKSFHPLSLWEKITEKWLLIVISLVSCSIIFLAPSGTVSVGFQGFFFSNVAFYYFRYLLKAFWPLPLAISYPDLSLSSNWQILETWGYLAVLSFFVFKKLAKRAPYLGTGWFWFLVFLAPSVGLNFEDRYMYLPLIGLLVAIAWGTAAGFEYFHLKKSFLALPAIALVLLCGAVSKSELKCWKNSETLFTHALEATKNNAVAHNILAVYRMDQKNMEEAIREFTKAIFLKPDFAEAHNNLAFALASQKKYGVALTHYQIALELKPDFVLAHNNIGCTLADLGKFDEAAAHLELALKIMPQYTDAKFNLANIRLSQANLREAENLYRELLLENPGDAQTHNELGVALTRQGRTQEALEHYRKALSLSPSFEPARQNMENALKAGEESSGVQEK